MKVTKKEIAQSTLVERGTGFNPYYKYSVQIGTEYFSRSYLDCNVYHARSGKIGSAENKKEFVDVVQEFLNEELVVKVILHSTETVRDYLIVQANDGAEAEEAAQIYLDNLSDVDEYIYTAGKAWPDEVNTYKVDYTCQER